MARQDAYHWRFFATCLGTAIFGIGALVLGWLVFPALRLLPGGPEARQRRARRTIQSALRYFIQLMRLLRVLTYELEGIRQLGRPGQIVVANHPSLIDAVFLIGFAPSSNCVVKHALRSNLFTRWTVTAAGYVSNSPTDLMIESASQALSSGQSVIIFPEGTRTTPGQALHFHRGAATIAIRAATVVTPVYIRCTPTILSKGVPWYRVPDKRVHLSLRVGGDIDPEPFRKRSPAPIAARAFNAHLLRMFEIELTRSEDVTEAVDGGGPMPPRHGKAG